MHEEYNLHDIAVYGGYIDDKIKLLQSSSGGIATALAEYILEQGGYVAGVIYSEDFYKAEYSIIHNSSDVNKLKGSKYIDCDKNKVYSDVKKLIDAGESVLFFGLPCVVAALYAFLGTRPDKLLTCELVCHGPTYPKVHYDYVRFLEKKFKSKVTQFSTRYKTGKWTETYLYAKFENGKIFRKPFYDTEYGYAFNMLSKKACYNCRFKGNNRQADIMIGDFWGATEKDAFWNNGGVSSVFAETEKGEATLEAIPGIKLFPVTFERVATGNPMVIRSKRCDPRRDVFERLLENKGLIYAVRHTMSFQDRKKKVMHSALWKYIRSTIKSFLPRYRK